MTYFTQYVTGQNSSKTLQNTGSPTQQCVSCAAVIVTVRQEGKWMGLKVGWTISLLIPRTYSSTDTWLVAMGTIEDRGDAWVPRRAQTWLWATVLSPSPAAGKNQGGLWGLPGRWTRQATNEAVCVLSSRGGWGTLEGSAPASYF